MIISFLSLLIKDHNSLGINFAVKKYYSQILKLYLKFKYIKNNKGLAAADGQKRVKQYITNPCQSLLPVVTSPLPVLLIQESSQPQDNNYTNFILDFLQGDQLHKLQDQLVNQHD